MDEAKTRFADLGIPFPLFEAPVLEAAEWAGAGNCVVCEAVDAACFDLDDPSDIVLPCPSCGAESALDAMDRGGRRCGACDEIVLFPAVEDDDPVRVCFACLRAGRAALGKETMLGHVGWTEARRGLTHGRSGIEESEFELVDDVAGWKSAKVPSEWLFELVRTPAYATWQNGAWRYCCRRPMVYIGPWGRNDFRSASPKGMGGRTYFLYVVKRPLSSEDDDLWAWKNLEDDHGPEDTFCCYVFRCDECGRNKGHWDFDTRELSRRQAP